MLKCDKSRATDHAALLYLSSNVKICKYGCEYAALLIKSHLELVVFSDLVNVVMILFVPLSSFLLIGFFHRLSCEC